MAENVKNSNQSKHEVKLREYADACGLTLMEAADYILLHYNMFDYEGADKEFIEYCEKAIIDEKD